MKYTTEIEGENGWTRWIAPKRRGYRQRCCDCGLVHVWEFRIVREGRGRYLNLRDRVPNATVVYRVHRDERATAASRRWKKRE